MSQEELEKEKMEAPQDASEETPKKASGAAGTEEAVDNDASEAAKEAAENETETAEADEAQVAKENTADNAQTVNDENQEKQEKQAEETPEESGGKEKTGFFGKKKKKDKKDEQIEELTDRVRRTMAEFENFRKRNEREKTHMYEVGARDIIEKMLPVMDSFERGMQSIPEDQKDNAVAQGMEMIYKQMLTAFEQIGVKEIEAVGKEFDPNFHNAVMHEDNEEVGENIITEEFQKGYTYKDAVVRHSMVKVAN